MNFRNAIISILIILTFQCCTENTNSIEDISPSIKITLPMDNSYFSYGDMIIFEVSVKSNSNNSVQLIWISDKDNEIGSNSSFNTNTLSLGEHEITVLAEFEKDLTLTSSINIFVEERNKNAVANIIPPEYDSLWYYNSEIVNFTVTVVDTIGNPINDYTCKWISSIDGLISKNNYFGVNSLSPGIHDLDLTVFFKDSTISKDSLQNITIVDDPYVGTGLLNDKQMLNEFDPDAPTVIEEWKNWTRGNSQPIRSIFSSNFKDLHFIDSYISNARIVQMGEVSHGAANQNRSRVRLIKYLHEELGFNVVAFESGFYEAYFSNIIITTMSDIDAMRNSISGRWNTLELFDLIRYVKSTHSSNNPLHIAGFDVKPSTLKILSRPGFFRDLMNIIDTEFAEDILLVDTKVVMYYRNRQTAISYVQQNYAELCQKYDHLIELIENYYSVFLEYYDIETVSIALEAAKSAREAINNINGNAYYQRDHQMAKTIIYLANELYENEKIIIWAHNVHVLEEPERIENLNGTPAYSKMMGKWLKEEFGETLYTIGTFSYRGSVYSEGVKPIDITMDNSLEAILYNSRKKYCFIDISQQVQNEGNEWMFNQITQTYLHRNGNYTIVFKPKAQYDGLLFIDTEKPPDYF